MQVPEQTRSRDAKRYAEEVKNQPLPGQLPSSSPAMRQAVLSHPGFCHAPECASTLGKIKHN